MLFKFAGLEENASRSLEANADATGSVPVSIILGSGPVRLLTRNVQLKMTLGAACWLRARAEGSALQLQQDASGGLEVRWPERQQQQLVRPWAAVLPAVEEDL